MQMYTLEVLTMAHRAGQRGIPLEQVLTIVGLIDDMPLSAQASKPSPVLQKAPAISKAPKGRAGAGVLTGAILSFLKEKGPEGETFKKIGKAVGRTSAHISSWYYGPGRAKKLVIQVGSAQIALKEFDRKPLSEKRAYHSPHVEGTVTDRVRAHLSKHPGISFHYKDLSLLVGTSAKALTVWWVEYGKKCPEFKKTAPGTIAYVANSASVTLKRVKCTLTPVEIGEKAANYLRAFGPEGAHKNEIGKALGIKSKAFVNYFYSKLARQQGLIQKVGPSMFAYTTQIDPQTA